MTRSLLLHSALRIGGMILDAAAVVWVVVTLAARPLDTLSQALATRRPGDLSPLRSDAPSEVWGLVQAVNGVIARLGATIEALHNFTGNASHQLRTLLAAVRAQLALATRESDPTAAKVVIGQAESALAEAERVLAQLLLLARVDASAAFPLPGPTILLVLARDLTAELVPSAARGAIDLGFDRCGAGTEPVLARADATLRRGAFGGDGRLLVARRGARGAAPRGVPDCLPGFGRPPRDDAHG